MTSVHPVADLTSHLGYWLRYVSNHVSHAFALKLEGEGVTVAEWVFLRELYGRERLAPSLLADRLGMSRGAISKLSDRLVAKGLVEREANASDARAHTLRLSPAGQALVPTLAALADKNDAEFFGHLTAADRSQIERVMRDIVRRRNLRSHPVS